MITEFFLAAEVLLAFRTSCKLALVFHDVFDFLLKNLQLHVFAFIAALAALMTFAVMVRVVRYVLLVQVLFFPSCLFHHLLNFLI